jgi:MFS transporter, DHA3 family, macrolide efflux protein
METSVGILAVLHNKRFRSLWLGQVVSSTGDYFMFLAIPILINNLTGSAAAIGGAMIVSLALPQLVFGIPAGVLVDRWDRRQVMIVSDLLRAVLVLGGLLVHTGHDIWILYVIGFLISSVSRFYIPAHLAIIPAIVEERELVAANGLTQLTSTAAILPGAVMAGMLIGAFGSSAAFIADSLSFVVSALAVWSIGAVAGAQVRVGEQSVRVLWRELVDGLRLLLANKALRGIMLSVAVVYLGIGAIAALAVPLMSRYHSSVGPTGIGLVYATVGLGTAVGGLAIGRLAGRFSKARICTVGMIVIGVTLVLLGIVPGFGHIILAAFICGLAILPVQAAITTLAQQLTPDHARGRVFSAITTFGQIALTVSIAGAAGMADLVGIRSVYVGCGVLVALAGVIFALLVKDPGPTQPGSITAAAEPAL